MLRKPAFSKASSMNLTDSGLRPPFTNAKVVGFLRSSPETISLNFYTQELDNYRLLTS